MKSPQPTQPARVRSLLLLKQVIGFICIAGAIWVVLILASRPAAIGKKFELSENSPQSLAMKHLLAASRDMAFSELCEACVEPRELVTKLSFDPTNANHFDQIKTKLKLTDQELQLYRQHGFVSVDHEQRYSFGSAYYQIYTAHLPVFVTSDSILHALHRSFDDLLAELESTAIVPLLDSILRILTIRW